MTTVVRRLRLALHAVADMLAHGARTYPDECCGALIADRTGDIVEAMPLPNTTDEGPRRRFMVAAPDYLAAGRRAEAIGGAIAGFYHSHPDHPARPSATDLAAAWPNLSYVIVSVVASRPAELTSWRLRDDRSGFDPEEVETCPSA